MAKSTAKPTQRTTSITPSNLADSLTAFSPSTTRDSSLYAHLHRAPDAHTLRIYDARNGKCTSRWSSSPVGDEEELRVEAIEWVVVPSVGSAGAAAAGEGAEAELKRGKKRRKSDSAAEKPAAPVQETTPPTLLLAMGLSNASILLWNPTASTSTLLSHASCTSPVTSLAVPADSTHLWSSHADGSVRVWDLTLSALVAKVLVQAGGKSWDSMSVRYVGSDAQLLLSRLTLSLFTLPNPVSAIEKKVKEIKAVSLGSCPGHITACHVLFPSFTLPSEDNIVFLSYASTDRFVQVWSLPSAPTSANAQGTLLARLALSSGVASVSLGPGTSAEQVLAGIDAEGVVSLARLSADVAVIESGKKGKKIKILAVETEVVGQDGSAGVSKVLVGGSGSVVVVRGGVKPVFELVEYANSNGEWTPSIALLATVNGLLTNSDSSSSALPTRYSEHESSTVRSGAPAVEPTSDDDEENANSGALDVDLAEPSLADRLKALEVNQSHTGAAQDGNDDSSSGSGSDDSDSEGSDEEGVTTIPSATLTTTLIQALHSSDTPLLESCLAHTGTTLIRATVKRLPSGALVLSLLEVLVEKLGKSGEGKGSVKRAKGLVQWVRQVLIVHVGFLVTVPSLVTRLAVLHSTLTARLALLPTLLALSGRMELVMSQIDLRQDRSSALSLSSKKSPAQIKGKTYVEGESEDDEEEEDDDEEGSVEDVLLGSAGEEEDDEDDEDEDDEDEDDEMGEKKGMADLLDLEASEESGSEEDDEDESEQSEDEDDD